jgi:hypothetical protein
MPKKYRVTLTAEEREQLTALVAKGTKASSPPHLTYELLKDGTSGARSGVD